MVVLGVVQVLVVFASLGVAGLAVSWTVRSWVTLNEQDYDGWVESRCEVVGSKVAEDPSPRPPEDSRTFRSEILVNSSYYELWGQPPTNISRPALSVTAFRTGNASEYEYSREGAAAFNDAFQQGGRYRCWFDEALPTRVKLTSDPEGTLSASESALTRGAIVSTALSVLTGLCAALAIGIMVLIAYSRSRHARSRSEPSTGVQPNQTRANFDDENPLLPTTVVPAGEERVAQLHAQRECCSVCLDPLGWRYSHDVSSTGSAGANQHGAVIQLPCAHNFHELCVLAWYARGNTLCPVCKQTFVPRSASDLANCAVDTRRDVVR
uniref:RING-type domain-containing protein n=1 Tax=Erythrolobus australicus TaxID=1077150 RepID=A0A7S1XH71_9RHOD|mmetsp:Transcript_3692/g.10254  ORF Transcript_3692/g.10254 Transcript_3692/m.10254 type:complete len:323 (+) Transcript_3692:94-1062(+)